MGNRTRQTYYHFVHTKIDMKNKNSQEYLPLFHHVLEKEAQALLEVCKRTCNAECIEKVIQLFDHLHCMGGKVITCGVGKSAIIAQKLASTLSSLGMPSFFLHPNEAIHGDLGKLSKADVIVFYSKSGTTKEIIEILPHLPMPKNQRFGILGISHEHPSTLSDQLDFYFDASVESEACMNNLAPTTSTTVALGVSDAICVVYEKWVGLSKHGFLKWHPGGILGKTLALKVSDLMIPAPKCASLYPEQTFQELILAMSALPQGICVVVDPQTNYFIGIIVEGDIRRALANGQIQFSSPIASMVNKTPITITPETLAYSALETMEGHTRSISVLPVLREYEDYRECVGIIRLHDILKEGIR